MAVDNEVQTVLLFVSVACPTVRQVISVRKRRAVSLTFLIQDVNSP
jgi:hypothetical protein